VNREERLRRELPGDLKDRAGELAGLPVATVDLIVAGLRASHRAGREYETCQRRQRRENRRRYGWVEDDQYADAAVRFLDGLGRRAGANLEALAALAAIIRQARTLLALAVAGARAVGYSDTEIGEALGHPRESARQAVGQRFGPRSARATPERPAGADPVPAYPLSASAAGCKGSVDSRTADMTGDPSSEAYPPSGPLLAAQQRAGGEQ
jgi:hypothetical protein